jgi:hypothetical protein
MTELQKANGATTITAADQVLNAHEYLKEFLQKFETAKRGGIHDFMELILFNMLQAAIGNIDNYLKGGHKEVVANEIMSIVADSYQKVLDGVKKNLDNMNQVNFR